MAEVEGPLDRHQSRIVNTESMRAWTTRKRLGSVGEAGLVEEVCAGLCETIDRDMPMPDSRLR